jgi:class 3 adenylate cyclase
VNILESVDLLSKAQGRSEFVVVVFADIRGFSKFSRVTESPNIAMYVKRLYTELLSKYFATAKYSKPTGDGLLIVFEYGEDSLKEVSQSVITSCLLCHDEFNKICADDPMLNFELPAAIGFGVARGTACCLHAGDKIIDYSGHLLNLAARLNDIARPSGVVIDANFKSGLLSEELAAKFSIDNVYLRGVAEDKAVSVLYQAGAVEISQRNKIPLARDQWHKENIEFTYKKILALTGLWQHDLPFPVASPEKIKVELRYPNVAQKGLLLSIDFDNFTYMDSPEPCIKLDLHKAISRLASGKLKPADKIRFVISYIPAH